MTVLLVDDQVNILNGLISGIDWAALGVTSILTAGHAAAAQEILLRQSVDILLCDIEMPGENGLALLRWARSQKMDMVCVFLTSHADFLYAREAMSLNCFDYILQPARYQEIQHCIERAIVRVHQSKEEKRLTQYGRLAQERLPDLFRGIFSKWISGQEMPVGTLVKELRRLSSTITLETLCFVIWGHLLNRQPAPWNAQDWHAAVNERLQEAYANCGVVPFYIDETSTGWLVYSNGQESPWPAEGLEPIEQLCRETRRSDLAFYVTKVIPLNQINSQAAEILALKKNNVIGESCVFRVGSLKHLDAAYIDELSLQRWEKLLARNSGRLVRAEALRYLDTLTGKGQMNSETLRCFFEDFQQIVLHAARENSIARHTALLKANEASTSLAALTSYIEHVTQLFIGEEESGNSSQDVVQQVMRYVEANLDKPLNVSEIATALFMNADYLSRLFRSKTKTTLKRYILSRKMDVAQQMLNTTTLPVSVIALKLGFDNFSYFSQLYRKSYGISPSQERRGEE